MAHGKRILRSMWLGIVCLGAVVFFVTSAMAAQGGSKGIEVRIKDRSGKEVGLYKGSYALLIGASKYRAGWPTLPSVPGEMATLKTALEALGFQVREVSDPDGGQLKKAFDDFIASYGYDPENRLLFFFSGHGFTRKEGSQGYLVPVDAPLPRRDEKGFLRLAIPMTQVQAWAKQIEARHALFVFDSCFSGTIFKTKDPGEVPPHISDKTARAVRQFITAGDADQSVPAKSVFTPSFVRGLEGEADLDKDRYVTGTELGEYLHKKVLSYNTGQTPQCGKLRDPDYDQGDFVFQVAVKEPPPVRDEARKRLEEELSKAQAERESAERRAKEVEEKRKIADLQQKIAEERRKKEEALRRLKEEQEKAKSTSVDSKAQPMPDGSGSLLSRIQEIERSLGVQSTSVPAEASLNVDETGQEPKPTEDLMSLIQRRENEMALAEKAKTKKSGFLPISKEIKRDGVYVAYANGIVKDTSTGLEWVAGPDKNMTWDQAKSWVESLNLAGGGWRMPTTSELEGLYKKGWGDRNMTTLLKTTGWWVWSGETKGSSGAGYFGFSTGGYRGWDDRSLSLYFRAFAVRSRSGSN